LALQAAREALNQAELEKDFLRTLKAGVCLGTTVGSAMNNEAFYQAFKQGLEPDMSPIHRFLKSNPAACLAREYGLDGPCQTVVNACSSGTDAIGLAASWIESGYCDLVLAGGSDELSHVTYNGFISLMISDDAPCRPFDRERKGLNLGEGAAVMVLESEKTRQGRRKKAKAFILGYGAACDAHHLTAPHPEGNGLKQAIREALQVSGTTAEDLSFINAHGTGTRDNDRVETLVLQEYLAGVPFLSTKGFTGHTLGAAGAIEAVFTAACLETGQIPESAGFIVDDPELPCSPVKEATTVKGKAALSQSLAFGGHNAVIVIGQGEERL
jgi:3-oxoacyl-[acyl-carrier-protein] synthase-1/3-oxoacyl-[acyl-carrier-protein] synthase II